MISQVALAHGRVARINCFDSAPRHASSLLHAPAFLGGPRLASLRVAPPQRELVSSSPRHGRSAHGSPRRHGRLAAFLFDGKGEAADEKGGCDGSLWNSLGNALGKFKRRSVDDLLRDQIREQATGGSGDPPIGRRGGGGGDGSGDTGGEGEAAAARHEFFQVLFATLGFLFLYVYMIYGRELRMLGKDYIAYLSGGKTTLRLRLAMDCWEDLRRSIGRLAGLCDLTAKSRTAT